MTKSRILGLNGRIFVLNTGWKRHYIQMMLFVNVCSTWCIVDLETRVETWITRNVLNGVGLFHLYYLITIMACLCSQRTPNVQIKYFMFDWSFYWLFVLNTGWKRDSLQMMVFVNICSTCSIIELKTRFETWITRNVGKCVSLFHLCY
jgi:hypothetical protein